MPDTLPNVFAAPRTSTEHFANDHATLTALALAGVWGIERNLLDKLNHRVPAEWVDYDVITVIGLIAVGIPFGWVLLYVLGASTAWASRLLGRPLSAAQMRGVLAASCVPRIGSVVLLFGLLLWTGPAFYLHDREGLMRLEPLSIAPIGGAALLDLWALVVLVVGLAEVGKMSVLRAFVVYSLGALPMVVLVLLLAAAVFALL